MPGRLRAVRGSPLVDVRVVAAVSSVVLLAVFLGGGLLRDGRPGQVPWLDVGVFNAVYLLAAAQCGWPRGRADGTAAGMVVAWRLLGLALATDVVANVCFSWAAGIGGGINGGTAGGLADLSDVLYLAACPASWLAVILAVRVRVRHFLASVWSDGAVTAFGVAAALLCTPAAHRLGAAGPGGGWVALAYPIADLAQLSLLVTGAVLLQGRSDRVLVVAGLGLAAVASGDVLYLLQRAAGTYTEGGLSDAVDLGGVVLLGLAACARERRPARPPAPDPQDVGWSVLVLPSVAAAGSALLLAVPSWGSTLSRSLATACVVCALVRMSLTLGEIRKLGEVHRQARTDDLTGLPNRRAFFEQCDTVVVRATTAAPAALILLDLDHFKEVNDSLGHAVGDALLVQVADRLRTALPDGAVAARLAGDEFAVLLAATGEAAALTVAARIEQVLGGAFTLDGASVRIGGSLGVAVAPAAADSRRELLHCADVAMYRAKADGGGIVAHSAVAPGTSVERLRTAEELRRTLEGGGGAGSLVVHLQPQVRTRSRDVVGMEALVRWEHPTRGLLPPVEFLGIARTAGMMGEVTERVLDLALGACRTCWDAGHRLPVSVNVTAAGLHDVGLSPRVADALRRHSLPPEALVIELTEDTLMTRPDRACRVLDELRVIGVGVSIDDYGTGYSSLAYLRQLPVDELKLDRVFVADLTRDPAAGAIVRHTVELAHSLGIRLVAEGVEDETTLRIITLLGGDVAQGYHVARPMTTGQLLSWLAARPCGPVAPSRGTSGPDAAIETLVTHSESEGPARSDRAGAGTTGIHVQEAGWRESW